MNTEGQPDIIVCSATLAQNLTPLVLSGAALPVEQMIPMSAYSKLLGEWWDAKNENDQLRQEIANLKAQLEHRS